MNAVTSEIVDNLLQVINKKNPKLKIKNFTIKNNLSIFINCTIENPNFDTQTKEYLTCRPANFGSACKLGDSFFAELMKTNLVDRIIQLA